MRNLFVELILLCISLEIISVLIMLNEYHNIKKMTKVNLEEIKILKLFSETSIKYYDYDSQGLFDSSPNIKKYLNQSNILITNCPYDFDKVDIGPKNKKLKNAKPLVKKSSIQNIPSEMRKAPKEVNELLFEFLETLDRLYKIKYPVKHKIKIFKNFFRFLSHMFQMYKNIKTPKKENVNKAKVMADISYAPFNDNVRNDVVLRLA